MYLQQKKCNSGEPRRGKWGWACLAGQILVFLAIAAFVIISTLNFDLWLRNVEGLSDLNKRAIYGDQFGMLNALFSGLAFLGMIVALFMQRHELELQRKELSATREEMEAQTMQFKLQMLTSALPAHRSAMAEMLRKQISLVKIVRDDKRYATVTEKELNEEFTLDSFDSDMTNFFSQFLSMVASREKATQRYAADEIREYIQCNMAYILSGLDILRSWAYYSVSWGRKVKYSGLTGLDYSGMMEDFWESLPIREQFMIVLCCIRKHWLTWDESEGVQPLPSPLGPSIGLFRYFFNVIIDSGEYYDRTQLCEHCEKDEMAYVMYKILRDLHTCYCSKENIESIIKLAINEFPVIKERMKNVVVDSNYIYPQGNKRIIDFMATPSDR